MLICKGEVAADLWYKSLENLDDWRASQGTDPQLSDFLLEHLRGWYEESLPTATSPDWLHTISNAQKALGCDTMLYGILSQEWALHQHEYYSKRSGKRGLTSLIKNFVSDSINMWEHRNGSAHDKENATTAVQEASLDTKIRYTYFNIEGHNLDKDRHLLMLSLSDLLRKSSCYKITWLREATTVLQVSQKNAWQRSRLQARSLRQMRRMRTWLSTQNP